MIGLDSFSIISTGKGPAAWTIKGLNYPERYRAGTGPSMVRTGALDLSSTPDLVGSNAQWTYSGLKKGRQGPYHVFRHHTGTTLGATEDGTVLFVSGNVSKLETGLDHNGTIVSDPQTLWSCMARVRQTLEPVLERPVNGDFAVSALEIGGVVRSPFSQFWSLLSSINYPGLKKAPCLNPGESMKFGTSSSSTFTLRIYDKGRQLKNTAGMDLPLNTYTRVEIVLRKGKLWDAFGGERLPGLTLQSMEDQFYSRVYRILPEPVRDLSVLPASKAGVLAMSLLQSDRGNGPDKSVMDWWLEQNKHSQNAKSVLKQALALLQGVQGIGMENLVPRNGPVINLPEGP